MGDSGRTAYNKRFWLPILHWVKNSRRQLPICKIPRGGKILAPIKKWTTKTIRCNSWRSHKSLVALLQISKSHLAGKNIHHGLSLEARAQRLSILLQKQDNHKGQSRNKISGGRQTFPSRIKQTQNSRRHNGRHSKEILVGLHQRLRPRLAGSCKQRSFIKKHIHQRLSSLPPQKMRYRLQRLSLNSDRQSKCLSKHIKRPCNSKRRANIYQKFFWNCEHLGVSLCVSACPLFTDQDQVILRNSANIKWGGSPALLIENSKCQAGEVAVPNPVSWPLTVLVNKLSQNGCSKVKNRQNSLNYHATEQILLIRLSWLSVIHNIYSRSSRTDDKNAFITHVTNKSLEFIKYFVPLWRFLHHDGFEKPND